MAVFIAWLLEMFFNHQYLTPFISGFITEEALFAVALIGGMEMIPFHLIILFGFLGIVTSDVFWFLFIKIKPLLKFSEKVSKRRRKLASKTRLGTWLPPTSLKSYILTKFTFGLRTWGIFYCSVHKMPLRKFIIHTSIATAIWMIVMLTLAKILGKGIFLIFKIGKGIGEVILVALVLIILITFIIEFITLKILKKTSN